MSTLALSDDLILHVDDLCTHFVLGHTVAKSVDGVSFEVKRGQTLAIVGESGSGKSVTSLSIMRLLAHPGQIVGGKILYRTRTKEVIDLAKASGSQMRHLRGREIAMIFQEPMTSLNPLYTVGQQIEEMLMLHEPMHAQARRQKALHMLELVEIPDAALRLHDYPHQMSGGMRQRVMIAMALACHPSLLIADEPTTALDVTIQAQILDLLRRLQKELGMSILFITHNLGVVAEIAHEVVVMYAGRVVEQADVYALFSHQKHPYTQGLLACMPDPKKPNSLKPIPGTVPPITDLPKGCSFAPRCPNTQARCQQAPSPLLESAGDHHFSRCWYHASL